MARLRWLTLWCALVLAWFAGGVSVAGALGEPLRGAATGAVVGVDRGDGDHAAVLESASEVEAADAEAEPVPLPASRARVGLSARAVGILRTLILPGAIAPRDGPASLTCCLSSRRWSPEGAQGPPRLA